MKGFIEVTYKESRTKICLAISGIKRVSECNGGQNANITTKESKKYCYGFTTDESYAEVVKKIREAVE